MKKETKVIRKTLSGKKIPAKVLAKYYSDDEGAWETEISEEARKLISTVTAQIIKARKDKGLTREQLSKISGVPLMVIEDLENENSALGVTIYILLSQYLDLEISIVTRKRSADGKNANKS